MRVMTAMSNRFGLDKEILSAIRERSLSWYLAQRRLELDVYTGTVCEREEYEGVSSRSGRVVA